MPFTRVDVDIYDEIVEELGPEAAGGGRPSGEFEYESAEATFKPAKLGKVARTLLEGLMAAGARTFRVRYDGGYDEGFSHPDDIGFEGPQGRCGVAGVAKSLGKDAALIQRLRASVAKDSVWGNAEELYAKASDAKVVTLALDELAHELASRLLGEGFGTGEYQLYGAFTADLVTGQITDDPDAPAPEGGID